MDLLLKDERVTSYLDPGQVEGLIDATAHTGTASERALAFAQTVRQQLN